MSEEVIRGLQVTMATQLEFSYYRTIDKSEVDLVIAGNSSTVPVKIRFNHMVKKDSLRGLENFLVDTGSSYGIPLNRGKRPELLDANIVQIPVNYL